MPRLQKKKRAKVFAQPKQASPLLLSDPLGDDSLEEADAGFVDESIKIHYQGEDGDDQWSAEGDEEGEAWDDLDDEVIAQKFASISIKDDPTDVDWIPPRWRKAPGEQSKGEFG
jgi:hypothetical protein